MARSANHIIDEIVHILTENAHRSKALGAAKRELLDLILRPTKDKSALVEIQWLLLKAQEHVATTVVEGSPTIDITIDFLLEVTMSALRVLERPEVERDARIPGHVMQAVVFELSAQEGLNEIEIRERLQKKTKAMGRTYLRSEVLNSLGRLVATGYASTGYPNPNGVCALDYRLTAENGQTIQEVIRAEAEANATLRDELMSFAFANAKVDCDGHEPFMLSVLLVDTLLPGCLDKWCGPMLHLSLQADAGEEITRSSKLKMVVTPCAAGPGGQTIPKEQYQHYLLDTRRPEVRDHLSREMDKSTKGPFQNWGVALELVRGGKEIEWVEGALLWASVIRVSNGLTGVQEVFDPWDDEGAEEEDMLQLAKGCAIYDRPKGILRLPPLRPGGEHWMINQDGRIVEGAQ